VLKTVSTDDPHPSTDNRAAGDDERELEVVRELLFSTERARIEEGNRRLDALEQRLGDPDTRAQEASEILVPAVRHRLSADEALGDALKPVVVEQFHQTAREDPDVMAEALFPILGPAIRKMITGMFKRDEKSKTRTYRLEQLFLIDQATGLPICHVASEKASTQDADMVSGMLNAIQSFVHEAFSANEFDGLNTLEVGDVSVWIEWGPSAVLAGVIRGNGPQPMREAMQLKLEDIHREYTKELIQYDGDASPFEPLKPELLLFLDSHDGSLKNKLKNLSLSAKKWLGGSVVVLALLLVWLIYDLYDAYRWNTYLESVEAMPGIVITQTDRTLFDYRIRGLRDPLAQDPLKLLERSTINADSVHLQFEPYQALHPGFTLKRAETLLEPPEGVTLKLQGSTLLISGDVDAAWAEQAVKLATVLTGVERVVSSY